MSPTGNESVATSAAPQRIAQLIESDGPGGAESVVLELCAELRRRGREVFPVVFGEGEGWLSGRMQRGGFDVYLPVLRSGLPIDVRLLPLARLHDEHLRRTRWSDHRGTPRDHDARGNVLRHRAKASGGAALDCVTIEGDGRRVSGDMRSHG